jgi:hypothetical protein
MANVIPVDGAMGPDVPYVPTFIRLFPSGCLLSHDHLENGRMVHSRLDVTEVNPAATELVGTTIYGPVLVSRIEEAYSG